MSSPSETLDNKDPGDDVISRFQYQFSYAAIIALRLVTHEHEVSSIICENFEDILVERPSGLFVAVQVNTKTLDQRPFRANDTPVFKAIKRFCELNALFPDCFESFELVSNHTFWNENEAAQDVQNYVFGFHSERMNELQRELSQLRQDQRVIRESANQIMGFLAKFGFSSQDQISHQIDELSNEVAKLETQIQEQVAEKQPNVGIAEEDAAQIIDLTNALNSKNEAISEISARIDEQQALIAEFISMKFKAARANLASELLQAADFEACPACGTSPNPNY